MSFFSTLACSFSTLIVFVGTELLLLFLILWVEKLRLIIWTKLVTFRYLILLGIIIQLAIAVRAICFRETQEVKPIRAMARMWQTGMQSGNPIGIIEFEEIRDKSVLKHVLIRGRIINIFPSDSLHGLHIHNVANYTLGCDSTGGHYNPLKRDHGDISNPEKARHVGDLGNVRSDFHGLVNVNLKDTIIQLTGNSSYNVIGKPLVIHAGEDDLGLTNTANSKVNGNSGQRLACGTIIFEK